MTIPGFEAFIDEFLLDANERVRQVQDLLLKTGSAEGAERETVLNDLKRELHTLKGNAGMMGFTDIQGLAHEMEENLQESEGGEVDVGGLFTFLDQVTAALKALSGTPKVAPEEESQLEEVVAATEPPEGSVRIPFSALDELMDLLAEMVIIRNQLTDAVSRGRMVNTEAEDFAARARDAWDDLAVTYEGLGKTLDFIQDRVVRLRMVPLGTLFGSLKRIVYDEGVRTGKEVELETSGGEAPLDKSLLELASEALGHLIRNAVIHGIELPNMREAAGKPRGSVVRVLASARGDEVLIEVSDDGAGIDPVALRNTAEQRGINMSLVEDVYSVLFFPGFSTRTEADLSSGRGVGLSAVLEAVQEKGGTIEVTSEIGVGTTFHLRLPLSISIVRTLLLAADGEEYALPLPAVVDSRRFYAKDGHQVNHAGVIRWRDKLISLMDIGYNFGTAEGIREQGYLIVIEAAGKHRGLLADEIKGIREVVVKGLDPIVGNPPGVAGSTVLGDGRPILILDPRGLVEIEPFVKERV